MVKRKSQRSSRMCSPTTNVPHKRTSGWRQSVSLEAARQSNFCSLQGRRVAPQPWCQEVASPQRREARARLWWWRADRCFQRNTCCLWFLLYFQSLSRNEKYMFTPNKIQFLVILVLFLLSGLQSRTGLNKEWVCPVQGVIGQIKIQIQRCLTLPDACSTSSLFIRMSR